MIIRTFNFDFKKIKHRFFEKENLSNDKIKTFFKFIIDENLPNVQIKSLDGISDKIRDVFDCEFNKLKSFEGLKPKKDL